MKTERPNARAAALVVPLLLVNTAAIYGQAGWAYDHLGHGRAIAVLFAAAVESIGVYLAAEAHAALMAGDASARLRLGSYLVGILVGSLNYAHFADAGYHPNPLAITFGLLSSISPMLWSIRSRSMNRDRLRELGQVDPRAVRFSILRWALFPVRTGSAFRAAVWAGIVQPAEAVAIADARRAARKSHGEPVIVPNVNTINADADVAPGPPRIAIDADGQPYFVPDADAVKPVSGPPRMTPKTVTSASRVAAARRRLPDATVAQIAARARVSETTARRHLKDLAVASVASPSEPVPVETNGFRVLADASV